MYKCVNYIRIKSVYIYKECTVYTTDTSSLPAHKHICAMGAHTISNNFWLKCVCKMYIGVNRCANKREKRNWRERKIKASQTCTYTPERYLWKDRKMDTGRTQKKRTYHYNQRVKMMDRETERRQTELFNTSYIKLKARNAYLKWDLTFFSPSLLVPFFAFALFVFHLNTFFFCLVCVSVQYKLHHVW